MKPIDLIISSELHEIVSKVKSCNIGALGVTGEKMFSQLIRDNGIEVAARQLLCMIALEASAVMVFRALAAVGGPDGIQRLRSMLESTDEAQRLETSVEK